MFNNISKITINLVLLFSISTFLLFCSSIEIEEQIESFENTKWVLSYFAGEKLGFTQFEKDIYIQFPSESMNQFRGFSGCNDFFGSYRSNQDSLRFLNIASTRMSCEFDIFEKRFIDILQKTNSYKIDKDVLILFDNDNAILKFQTIFNQ